MSSFATCPGPWTATTILKRINLHAPAGSTIAIMGPTGCGKTSLVNLIPRFFDPGEGQVLVDGIDVRELDLKQLRGSVGLVAQETFLFSDTLYGNLTYGQEDAPIERVREAAATAQAEEFIAPLEEGYETVVGERGVGLSGGQKQRASLARALMKQAPILILDDATSSVDMETETRIQQALRELEARATTFIIAHRISSVLHADQILVMDHGQIVERGRHAELFGRAACTRSTSACSTAAGAATAATASTAPALGRGGVLMAKAAILRRRRDAAGQRPHAHPAR